MNNKNYLERGTHHKQLERYPLDTKLGLNNKLDFNISNTFKGIFKRNDILGYLNVVVNLMLMSLQVLQMSKDD